MPRRNLFVPLAALVVGVLFAFFLIRILLLRYDRGDVYPANSTLRADPLGARAFYEALGATDQFQVARGFASVHRELTARPTSIFYLGLSLSDLATSTDEEIAAINDYLNAGGRVVITLQPERPSDDSSKTKKIKAKPETKKDAKPAAASPAADQPDTTVPKTQQEKYEREQFRKEQKDEPEAAKRELDNRYHLSLPAVWGFGWIRHGIADDKRKGDATAEADGEDPYGDDVMALRATPSGPEYKVPWKSALYFIRLEPEWQVEYYAKDKPVLIRRSWGKGEILIATDSYFVSNEALRNDRRPALLAFVAGSPGHLLFDEAHLGTEIKEGVMALAEQFRLQGYLYGMIFVAVLFLWRQSIPLVPPRELSGKSALGGTVSGKDSRSGLVNLLRRNIPAPELLRTCLAEWKRGVTPGRTHLQAKAAEMESLLAATDTTRPESIVQAYQHLREINVPRRVKGSYATKS